MRSNVIGTIGPPFDERAGPPSEDWVTTILPPGSRIAAEPLNAAGLRALASRLPEGAALAVTVAGGGPPERERAPLPVRIGRAVRVVLAVARRARIAGAVAARMGAAGLRTEFVDLGRPSDGRPLGLQGRRLRRAPNGIVVGLPGRPAPSPLELALAAAERALAAPVKLQGARVLASGVVMAELEAAGARWLLRVAGAATRPAMASAEALLDRLLARELPGEVRLRLVEPVARGRIQAAAWSLEQRRPGHHPRRLDRRVWGECIELLTALHSLTASDAPPLASVIAARIGVLEPRVDSAGARALSELERRLSAELSGLSRGWGHGDFHPGNLLVEGGGLGTVLDWDAGAPDSLPLLDLLHLVATARPAVRRLPHGLRCTRVLWPLAAAGGGEHIGAYRAATGMTGDRATLLALAQAYWLLRVARDLERFDLDADRDEWVEVNLRRPLAELASSARR